VLVRHNERTQERSKQRAYNITYIHGPVTRAHRTAEICTVFPIEAVFKIKMFEETDSAGGL